MGGEKKKKRDGLREGERKKKRRRGKERRSEKVRGMLTTIKHRQN